MVLSEPGAPALGHRERPAPPIPPSASEPGLLIPAAQTWFVQGTSLATSGTKPASETSTGGGRSHARRDEPLPARSIHQVPALPRFSEKRAVQNGSLHDTSDIFDGNGPD